MFSHSFCITFFLAIAAVSFCSLILYSIRRPSKDWILPDDFIFVHTVARNVKLNLINSKFCIPASRGSHGLIMYVQLNRCFTRFMVV